MVLKIAWKKDLVDPCEQRSVVKSLRNHNIVINHIHILEFQSVRLSVCLFALNVLLERAKKL
jgi:hypothetical protein